MRKALRLGFAPSSIAFRLRPARDRGHSPTRPVARRALEKDEAPRGELAMIRHPRGKAQDQFDVLCGRTRFGKGRGGGRTPRLQKFNGIVHSGFMLSNSKFS